MSADSRPFQWAKTIEQSRLRNRTLGPDGEPQRALHPLAFERKATHFTVLPDGRAMREQIAVVSAHRRLALLIDTLVVVVAGRVLDLLLR